MIYRTIRTMAIGAIGLLFIPVILALCIIALPFCLVHSIGEALIDAWHDRK